MFRISLILVALLAQVLVQHDDGLAQTLPSSEASLLLCPRVYNPEQYSGASGTTVPTPDPRPGNLVVGSVVNYQNYNARNAALEAPRQPLIGTGLTVRTKPFSHVEFGPTVSPYTDLNDPLSTAEDYYNITKALENQLATNTSIGKRLHVLEQKVSQIPVPGPVPFARDPSAIPVGQPAGVTRYGTYLNSSNFRSQYYNAR